MVTAGPLRGCASRALLVTCCLAGTLAPCVAVAQSEKPSEQAPPPNSAAATKPGPSQPAPTAVSEAERKARKAWQAAIAAKAPPKKGCFTATFPDTEWKEVPCTKPPQIPYPPKRGSHPNAIGGGSSNDASAQVASQIVSATGSFDSVTGVTSETGTVYLGPNCTLGVSGQPDIFSLQLNTAPFTTSTCTSPGCQGWQQFVYSNGGDGIHGSGFIQYWLLNVGAACPTGWNSYPNGTELDCWQNDPDSVAPGALVIGSLSQMSVTGNATAGGDWIVVMEGTSAYTSLANTDTVLNLAQSWNVAEFNIFGDGCSSQAVFNTGAQLQVRTSLNDGNQKKPICLAQSFTAETNNLNFGPGKPVPSGNPPALLLTQSSAGGASSACAAATSVGDTHLSTFDGLLYDFQAAGDYLLVQADNDFVVQARQVSGAPSWPNATTNTAVATRMGKSRVAICANPAQVLLDGRPAEVGDGATISLPGGVDVSRSGGVYTIVDQGGDSVRATVNDNGSNRWIDVAVGLGHAPQAHVSGLLANALDNPRAIAARSGRTFRLPVSFTDLYRAYGESWRVPPDESILCEEPRVKFANPGKVFYANDLQPAAARRARQICSAAGVKSKALLEACTLDVAVLGDQAAAAAYVHAMPPAVVMPPPKTGGGDHDGDHDKDRDKRRDRH